VWLIAALLLPMYNMLHLIGIAIVSVAAALLAAKFAPKETILQELPFYEGNHDLNHVAGQIADARDTLRRARRAVLTDKPETAALLGEIEETCAKIQSAILASPEDLPKIRRFLNYYLPTTEKLANKYALIHSQKAEGENLSAASADIEKAMVTLRDSFQKQLDALFSDDALDISTDITVLETLLARDNLN
jgi:5-bromo-4-chloroindolyl phosphate hydrolysis protein